MLFLLALCLAALFVFGLRNPLKKHPYVFYIGAAILTTVFSFVRLPDAPAWVTRYVLGLFQRGALATAFWVIVMYTGAFQSVGIRKHLTPIRGELSILAAVMTLCHNIFYGQIYYVRLFQNPQSLRGMQLAAAIVSVVMLVIMIPLTLISFPQLRRKMSGRTWKKLQRCAYGFYGLLYVHILLVMLPAARRNLGTYRLDLLLYSLVFLGYLIWRIEKALLKKDSGSKRLLRAVGAIVLVVLMADVVLLIQPPKKAPAIAETVPTTVPEITAPETTAPSENVPETTVPETSQPEETAVPTETEETGAAGPEETKGTRPTEPKETEGTRPAEPKPTEPKPTETEPTVPETNAPTEPPRKYKNGTFTGTGEDFGGAVITANVSIQDDKIVSIDVTTTQDESQWANGFIDAQDNMPGRIIASQSPEVDTVSHATVSSNGIKQAVRNALASAKN